MMESSGSGRELAHLNIGGGRSLPWVMAVTLSSLGFIFAADYYFEIASPSLIVVAALDETAHIATALIFLVGFWRVVNLWLAAGWLAGAVLIDLDHLPAVAAWGLAIIEAERPATHSLATILIVAGVAAVLPRHGRSSAVVFGASLGLATHLLRDLATGGVPLLWPVDGEAIEISYWGYAIAIIAGALYPLVRYLVRPLSSRYLPRNKTNTVLGVTAGSGRKVSDP